MSKAAKKGNATNKSKPAAAVEPKEVEEEETALDGDEGVALSIDDVFDQVDETVQESYDNTEAAGDRWAPDAGTYTCELVNDEETGECGRVWLMQPGEHDDWKPYPVLSLMFEIVDAGSNEELVGRRFEWSLFLKPYFDKRAKAVKTAFGSELKQLCVKGFGSDIPDLRTACRKVLTELGGTQWVITVKYKPGDDRANFKVKDIVEYDED